MTVAETILEQLGGRMFQVMCGVKGMAHAADSLTLLLPSRFAKDGINWVRVTLTGRDDYDLEFCKLWGVKFKKIATREGVYADNLREVFTAVTGLDCTL